MKTYVKARDVLESARRFHADLERFFENLADKAGRERIQILLDQMADRERELREGLEQYGQDHADRLLDEWIQYAPGEEMLETPEAEKVDADMEVGDVEAIAGRYNDQLAEFYAEAARRVRKGPARELLANLADRMAREKARRAQDGTDVERGM